MPATNGEFRGFKSNIITTSPRTIWVPDDLFLKNTNFTQEVGSERGVVRVNLSGDVGGVANGPLLPRLSCEGLSKIIYRRSFDAAVR